MEVLSRDPQLPSVLERWQGTSLSPSAPHSVLQVDPARIPAPRHVWSCHTLPVTDLHCGCGGPLARVATSSLDQTVKVAPVTFPLGTPQARDASCPPPHATGCQKGAQPEGGGLHTLQTPTCSELQAPSW